MRFFRFLYIERNRNMLDFSWREQVQRVSPSRAWRTAAQFVRSFTEHSRSAAQHTFALHVLRTQFKISFGFSCFASSSCCHLDQTSDLLTLSYIILHFAPSYVAKPSTRGQKCSHNPRWSHPTVPSLSASSGIKKNPILALQHETINKILKWVL